MARFRLINQDHELNDDNVMYEIQYARRKYERGEILECRDVLAEIVAAIDEFTEWEDKQKEETK